MAQTRARAKQVTFKGDATGGVVRYLHDKLSETVSVKDFGAVGDGVTDDTAAIQAAIDSMTNGGILSIPVGKYRLTDELVLNATGGLIIRGEGGNDFRFGSPVPSGSGTFLFQETDNKSIFVFTGGCSYTRICDLTLASSLTLGTSPVGTNRYGIDIRDTIPNVLWSLTFDNILFFNLTRGISCVDTNIIHAQDLSVAPVGINQCIFTYCQTGIYIDTNNADYWTTTNCFFFIPSGGDGFILKRFGTFYIHQTSAGSTGVSNNRFITVNGTTPLALEKLSIQGCQTENLTHAIKIDYTGTFGDKFVVDVSECIFELTSDIYLGAAVNYISTNNRHSGSNIYVDDANVRLSTREDYFSSADILFLTGTPETVFHHTDWGTDPSPTYSNWRFNSGKLISKKATVSAPNTTNTTMYTLPNESGVYNVSAYFQNDAGGYDSSTTIIHDGTNKIYKNKDEASGLLFNISGNDVQIWQNTGVTQTVEYLVHRL